MDPDLIGTYLTVVGIGNFVFPMDMYKFDYVGYGEICISYGCVQI